MSQHHAEPGGRGVTRRPRLTVLAAAGLLALFVGVGGCGDDDEEAASGTDVSSPSETTVAGEDTAPATESSAVDSTAADVDESTTPGDPPPDTDADDDIAVSTEPSVAPTEPTGATSEPGDTTGDSGPARSTTAATTGEGAPDDTTDGTATDSTFDESGPTTTGPPCEFVENASYPIERCNTGPAVAVLQQALQAAGFTDVTVDGFFGDETLFAVREFQAAEELTVDGIVDAETWAALDPQNVGNDDNGNGIIDPNEVDLST